MSWFQKAISLIRPREEDPPVAESSPAADTYQQRVCQQIEQYATDPIHDLPEIFHVWSHQFIGPGLREVFGVTSVNDLYVEAARDASKNFKRPCRILSVGCGDGTVEIDLAKSLRARGVADFRLEGADLSPILIERFQEAVQESGLQEHVFPNVEDLNATNAAHQYDLIMANHSLHHIVDLEKLFDVVKESLRDDGIFATCDMIGRNGHMRWPETAAIVDAIWPTLTGKQRFHHLLLQDHSERFVDHDCSDVGFEGVRAQDILYLILDRFNAYKFFGYGGFIDVFVDRGYGHGFDANNERDRQFITSLGTINDAMLDAGMIKPTVMMAYFTKEERGETHYRTRSARGSLRLPFQTPHWAQYYRS